MQFTSKILFGLVLVFGLVGSKLYFSNNGPTYLSGETIPIVATEEWGHFCISSQYEIPDIETSRAFGKSCWNGQEVPSKSIYLTFDMLAGGCEHKVLSGYFLRPQFSETRCFSKTEIYGNDLIKQGDVFTFAYDVAPKG